MTKIIIAVAFVLGFVLGFGLSTLLSFAFWFFVGLGIVLLVDTAAGLNAKACALRAAVRQTLRRDRKPQSQPERRKTVWVNL